MRKRNLFQSIFLSLCLLVTGFSLAACGDEGVKLDKIQIIGDSGSNSEIVITQGEEYDMMSNIRVVALYSDKTMKTLDNKDVAFSVKDIDTTIAKKTQFTASYGGCKAEGVVNVEKLEIQEITGFDNPRMVTSYTTNSAKANTFDDYASKGTKGFEKTGQIYIVGTDNPYIYAPELIAFTKSGREAVITKGCYGADIKLYAGTAEGLEEKQPLQGADLEKVATIDAEKFSIHFKTGAEGAVGKTFTISVMPKTDGGILFQEGLKPSIHTFKVVEGYNVYDVEHFSVIDNYNHNKKWEEYKKANGIELALAPSTIILHSDIKIEKEDIPSRHIYTAEEIGNAVDKDWAVGSLRDESGMAGSIYCRKMEKGSTFTLEGNYFQISAQNVPLIKREFENPSSKPDDPIVSHTTLLGFFGEKNEKEQDIAKVTLNNLNPFGNTKKSDDIGQSGGIIFTKLANVEALVENNFSQSWFISYFFEGGDMYQGSAFKPSCTLSNSNIYDAYNVLLYVWGVDDVQIKNSHMIGAGGPVMICDHYKSKKADAPTTGVPTNVTVTNSVLQSFVAGSEGWFQAYEGSSTLIKKLVTANPLFRDFSGKRIVRQSNEGEVELLNLVAVYKSSTAQDLTDDPIFGTFKDSTQEKGLDIKEFTYSNKAQGITSIKDKIRQELIDDGKNETDVNTIVGSLVMFQAYDGTVGIPSADKGWVNATKKNSMLDIANKFGSAKTYLNAYLFNGMAAVIGFESLSA